MAAYYFFFIFAAFSALSTLADVNIDCGSSESIYIDNNSVGWVGDYGFIQSGESQTVSSTNKVISTLRVFTTGKKNCYASIYTGAGSKILVRASFFYGNYDGKSSPPSFDLQFDGNYWTTVETSSTETVTYEAIYVTKVAYVSVCVAQTSPNQIPFFSALEVKNLDDNMYGFLDVNYAMYLSTRTAFGAQDIIRIPNDAYDRIWNPSGTPGTGLETVSSTAIIISSDGIDDSPPQAVMQNALAATDITGSIVLTDSNLPQSGASIYTNMYFSEVSDSANRSIQVYMDGKSAYSKSIVPPYEGVFELSLYNITASATTKFSLVASSDSALPPLINALELFVISDSQLTDGTYSDDVNGLIALLNTFNVLLAWGGDPCLPSPYSWEWINCTADVTPRVTALNLNSFGLSGFLPDFSSMTALESIDLSNNSIAGTIPDFLGTLPKLKLLNLANNKFVGAVPSSLTNNKSLKLILTGNPDLCTSGNTCTSTSGYDNTGGSSSKRRKNKKTAVIVGTTVPSAVLVWLGGFIALWRRRRNKQSTVAAASGGDQRPIEGIGMGQIMSDVGESVMEQLKVNINGEISSEINNFQNRQVNQQ